jgi:hypothetical protein
MAKENPLTLSGLTKYHEKTLVPFLKENFATKEDLNNLKEVFVTKEDLNNLKEVFVTKEEFEGLIDIVATKDELKSGISGLEKRLGEKIDNVGKTVKEIKTVLAEAHVL